MTTGSTTSSGRLVALDDDEALTLAATAVVGRIAFVRQESMSVLPVNFCLVGRDVYLRTGADTELLDAARSFSAGAFEADGVIEWSRSGWSVLIRGQLAEVTDFGAIDSVTRRLEQWVGDRSVVVRLTGDHVSARRIISPRGGVRPTP